MPLASRINTEPRTKRAKRGSLVPTPSNNSSAKTGSLSSSSSTASLKNQTEELSLNNGNGKTNNDHSTTSSTENDEMLASSKAAATKQAANKKNNKKQQTTSKSNINRKKGEEEEEKKESETTTTKKHPLDSLNLVKGNVEEFAESSSDTTTTTTKNNRNNAEANSKLNSTTNLNTTSLSAADTSAAFGSTSIMSSGVLNQQNTTLNNQHNQNEDTMMSDMTTSIMTTHHGHLPELSHTICLGTSSKAGQVLACGENLSNQLGLGCEVDDRKKPQLIKDLPTNIIQVAAGGMHSACLTQDGIVYTFGCNDEYALGRDNDEEIDKVDLPEKSIEITTGDSHTAALSESGVVYAWGTFRDGSGVLGLENKKIAKIPMKFKLKQKIVKISSGADHLVFLTSTGEVFTAGNSEHGQLGRISKYNCCRGGRRGCDMILEPGLVRFGKKKELQGNKQIEDIWTTPYCSFLQVKDSDLIIGFGLNNCYQLGLDDAENRYQPDILHELKFAEAGKIKKIIGGMHHTLFLDVNGFVYSMGSHRYGGLGHGKIDADLRVPVKIDGLKEIVDIAANTNVSFAIDKHGKVFNWGTNYSKQLGQDTEDDYFVPTLASSRNLDARDCYSVSVGGQHSLLIVSDEKDKEDSDESM